MSRIAEWRRELRSLPMIILGCAITGMAFSVFLVPNRIAGGGVTGLATVIYHWTGWPVGLVALVLNIPLFLIGFRYLGSAFGLKTLVATFALSFFIDVSAKLPSVTNDLLLAAIAGGAIMGFGLGLVFRQDSTTGGTDLAARIIHSRISYVSIAQILLVIDVLVVLLATISFRSYEIGLYSVVTLAVATKVIDGVTVGVNYAKAAHVISLETDAISARLLEELDRGVTGLQGRGMYTGKNKEVLVCVLKAREVPRLRRIVQEIDENAFVYITDAREVFGEGFQDHSAA
ncbi:MAG: YitT family protein [Spirochaetales bacterium]|nr:YitT family protein [Spirochaetales bacterium]